MKSSYTEVLLLDSVQEFCMFSPCPQFPPGSPKEYWLAKYEFLSVCGIACQGLEVLSRV